MGWACDAAIGQVCGNEHLWNLPVDFMRVRVGVVPKENQGAVARTKLNVGCIVKTTDTQYKQYFKIIPPFYSSE